jgi:hypothetical protein
VILLGTFQSDSTNLSLAVEEARKELETLEATRSQHVVAVPRCVCFTQVHIVVFMWLLNGGSYVQPKY